MLTILPLLLAAAPVGDAVLVRAGTIHLVGDGTVLKDGALLIEDGKIVEVGDLEAPAGVREVDYGPDATIVPGLVAPTSLRTGPGSRTRRVADAARRRPRRLLALQQRPLGRRDHGLPGSGGRPPDRRPGRGRQAGGRGHEPLPERQRRHPRQHRDRRAQHARLLGAPLPSTSASASRAAAAHHHGCGGWPPRLGGAGGDQEQASEWGGGARRAMQATAPGAWASTTRARPISSSRRGSRSSSRRAPAWSSWPPSSRRPASP